MVWNDDSVLKEIKTDMKPKGCSLPTRLLVLLYFIYVRASSRIKRWKLNIPKFFCDVACQAFIRTDSSKFYTNSMKYIDISRYICEIVKPLQLRTSTSVKDVHIKYGENSYSHREFVPRQNCFPEWISSENATCTLFNLNYTNHCCLYKRISKARQLRMRMRAQGNT